MKKTRYLRLIFNEEITQEELPAFRKAITERVGREYDLFHNHRPGSEGKTIHRYPMVQYKRLYKRPAILCMGDAVDQIHHLFANGDLCLLVDGRPISLEIRNTKIESYLIKTWNTQFHYRIQDWIALTGDAVKEWFDHPDLVDRLQLLKRRLRNHLVAMGLGIGMEYGSQIEVELKAAADRHFVSYKDIRFMAFDVEFSTNLFIPDFVGIGKAPSHGFGTIKMKKRKRHAKNATGMGKSARSL